MTKTELADALDRIRSTRVFDAGDTLVLLDAAATLRASHAAAMLGKRTSARKKASSQINGRLGGRPKGKGKR